MNWPRASEMALFVEETQFPLWAPFIMRIGRSPAAFRRMSRVPSVEPSSATMTSNPPSGGSRRRRDSRASGRKRLPFQTGITTETKGVCSPAAMPHSLGAPESGAGSALASKWSSSMLVMRAFMTHVAPERRIASPREQRRTAKSAERPEAHQSTRTEAKIATPTRAAMPPMRSQRSKARRFG